MNVATQMLNGETNGYGFLLANAQGAARKYGLKSISLLAVRG